ncbi:MAG: sigma-70 family RNA polymerase sigma factor [Myxococcota bacterium]
MDIHKQWLAAIARTRDKAAFASLFQYFAPRLRAYLLRGGADAIVVEELVQDVMLIVWRGAAEYDPRRAAVSTWIFTIARNRRIDRLRRARRPEPEVGDPHFTPSAPDAPDEHTAETRRAERLRLALQQLPEEQATILHQMYFDGRSQREIAASLNIPLGTVKSRVRLAMSRLRETLAEEVP